jgi:sn-glycerol 3-phosphate transport system ATP-binding protein
MVNVTLNALGKSYGSEIAVKEFDLEIEDGEFLVLLGPSGCGKSTMLRMIAGLESITTGDLLIGGTRMNEVAPKDRGVAMVFQNYALYPHKTVAENMGMALKLQKMPKSQVDDRVADVAEMLGLTAFLDRKPGLLSGGQRQRVAIGRAIVRTPDVFLFDEPLSNLDAKLRVKMRKELKELHQRLGVTSIYVTHDQVEAMTLADRIVILEDGVIAQVGTPREVYDHPANEFVAGFIGSPAMNFISMDAQANGGWRSTCSEFLLKDLAGVESKGARNVNLGVRPEHIEVIDGSTPSNQPLVYDAEVRLIELLGADALLSLSMDGEELLARVSGADHPEQGALIKVHINPARLHVFDPITKLSLKRSN